MIKDIEILIPPDDFNDTELHREIILKRAGLNSEEVKALQLVKRSVDARSRQPKYLLRYRVFINEKPEQLTEKIEYKEAKGNKKVIVVGSGPAGLFAALKLLESGIKPVIFERGKDIQSRRRDLRAIQQDGIVNPESNYCFGEGGAGTYSDGKLYTRSKKRGDVNRILQILVNHGAEEDILIDSHPHIGSNKLPKIITEIRETIIRNGGEVFFNSKVTDLIISNSRISGVVVNNETEYSGDAVILATGHSARDIYYLLDQKKIQIEAKPFAMGVRIEHPQKIIDRIQYHSEIRHPNLPASSYSLTCQAGDRGVYSFCMCPGGIIVPASTAPEELVLNGMSVSRRDSPFANSGLVVTIDERDWAKYSKEGELAGLKFQQEVEKKAFEAGGRTQTAPAQRITDFVNNTISQDIPDSSYVPGIIAAPLHEILPDIISSKLKEAIIVFGKKMKGYYTEEAQILAAETRTSTPVRIPRKKDSLQHTNIEGLYPCGEGAGYAGGIVSAAIDGEKCVEKVIERLTSTGIHRL